MTQLNRLHQGDMANGNLIDAGHLNAEFNQLVSESNAQDTRLSTVETGNLTLGGVKIFTSPIKLDSLEERTAGTGITAEAVRLLDGRVKLGTQATAPTSPEAGELWFGSGIGQPSGHLSAQLATQAVVLQHSNAAPPRFQLPPSYLSDSQIKLPAGTCAINAQGSRVIRLNADITLSLASAGLAGLDIGSEQVSTWYYAWLIADSTQVNAPSAVLSTSLVTPALPTGYDTAALIPGFAIRNDASGDILPFTMTGWPYAPTMRYNVTMARPNGSPGPTSVLEVPGGSASTSYADINCSSFIPPFATTGLFWLGLTAGGSDSVSTLRPKDQPHEGFGLVAALDDMRYPCVALTMATSATQVIQYKSSVASPKVQVAVVGWQY